MRRSIRLVAAAAMVAVPMVLGVAAPAGARPAAPRFSAATTAGVVVPNSDIKGTGAKAKFKPAKLTAETFFQASDCDDQGNVSFSIANPGTKPAKVTYLGKPAFTIPGHTFQSICVYGPPGKLVLGLRGSTHKLTVTLLAD
jgi:hypothetical protein